MDKITVYTDGSALNNGSPDSGCGWACKLIYRGREKMKSGSDKGKTNNFMENDSRFTSHAEHNGQVYSG